MTKKLYLRLINIVLAIGVAFVVSMFLSPGKVHHTSMEPTFLDSDTVLIDKLTYTMRMPQRGEIAVLWDSINQQVLIKRVIAVGGDEIKVTRRGQLYIDDELVEEPYLKEQYWSAPFDIEMTLPKDALFVMGDNRDVSYDSRSSLGYVNKSQLMGRVVFNITKILKGRI